jgi:hypothetical protein
VERVRGAERLQDQGLGKPGGNQPRKKFPAVRRSLFGHRERSNSLRDGDKQIIFFSEVNEAIFPRWSRKVNATIKIYAVGTVSGGGCVERKVKPHSEAKTAKLAKSIKINAV